MGFLLFCKNNLERVAAVAVADRNLFRKDRLYTPEVGARGHGGTGARGHGRSATHAVP